MSNSLAEALAQALGNPASEDGSPEPGWTSESRGTCPPIFPHFTATRPDNLPRQLEFGQRVIIYNYLAAVNGNPRAAHPGSNARPSFITAIAHDGKQIQLLQCYYGSTYNNLKRPYACGLPVMSERDTGRFGENKQAIYSPDSLLTLPYTPHHFRRDRIFPTGIARDYVADLVLRRVEALTASSDLQRVLWPMDKDWTWCCLRFNTIGFEDLKSEELKREVGEAHDPAHRRGLIAATAPEIVDAEDVCGLKRAPLEFSDLGQEDIDDLAIFTAALRDKIFSMGDRFLIGQWHAGQFWPPLGTYPFWPQELHAFHPNPGKLMKPSDSPVPLPEWPGQKLMSRLDGKGPPDFRQDS